MDIEALPRARAKFVKPMLAQAVHELPNAAGRWIYELKLDGYRCIAVKDAKRAQLFSRNHNLFNFRFPTIATALAEIEPGTDCWRDEAMPPARAESGGTNRITEWTDGDRLRHSKFAGLREDKDPKEVTRENAA